MIDPISAALGAFVGGIIGLLTGVQLASSWTDERKQKEAEQRVFHHTVGRIDIP